MLGIDLSPVWISIEDNTAGYDEARGRPQDHKNEQWERRNAELQETLARMRAPVRDVSDALHLGNCLEVLRGFPADQFGAVLADLPYGTTACEWDSVIPLQLLWEQIYRVTRKMPRSAYSPQSRSKVC